jgi:HK97 gp10 family phage protein
MSVTMSVDMGEVNAWLDGMASTVEDASRPAAQAGAQVLYDEVRRNVAAIGKKSGNLERSIYQVFSKDQSAQGRATYHVSWNARKAPHGHLVEYGHVQRYKVVVNKKTGKWVTLKSAPLAQPRHVGARPFVRPAMAKFPAAVAAAKAELFRRLDGKT